MDPLPNSSVLRQKLEKALGCSKHEELRLLLPQLPEPKKDIRVFGQSIAHLSAQEGWWTVVHELVDRYGCIPSNDEVDDLNGKTMLHYACDRDDAMIKTVDLLTRKCLFNPLEEDHNEETPLDLCTGQKKQFLEGLIGESKASGFDNVMDYLKEKREKAVQQTVAKAVTKESDNVSVYKFYITRKPGADATGDLKDLGLQETDKCKKMFVTDFNIANNHIQAAESLAGIFYCNRSHFIVAIQLIDDEQQHSNGDNDIHDTFTNYDLIVRMCQLAKSIAVRTRGKFIPKVFIVGTHVDKKKNAAKYIKKLNEKLKCLHNEYSDVLVSVSAYKNEFIYLVDETVERTRCIAELQKHIFITMGENGGLQLPRKWFELFKCLNNNCGITKLSKCYEFNKKVKMTADEVEQMLKYFDSLMLLHYCPVLIPDTIVTKIDPFVTKLRILLNASQEKESINLRKKGLFKKTFLRKHCVDQNDDILISDEVFLKLLETFRMTVRTTERGEEFFFPSVLSIEPPSAGSDPVGGVSPLALLWDQHALPHGFFLTFVIELNKLGRKDCCRFQPCNDKPQLRNEIYLIEANQRIPGVLKLTDREKWIQVSYLGADISAYCSKVLDVIDRAIQQAIDLYQFTGITSPIIRCVCPLCKEKDHYCYAYLTAQFRHVICSKDFRETGDMKPEILCWLQGDKHGDETNLSDRLHPEKNQPVDDKPLDSDGLNIVAVRTAIDKVIDWPTLGLLLGIPQQDIERMKRDEPDESAKLQKMVVTWLGMGNASWKSLVQALDNPLLNKHDLAREISEEHPFIPDI